MISGKHITKIVAVIMVIAVCLCLCGSFVLAQNEDVLGEKGVNMEYESTLFNTDTIISVNVLMDDDEWKEMLKDATSEEYRECDVEVNGQTFYRVGIRPKGNTSLSSIAKDSENDRYSFKLEFDKYVEGQTCFGLDKLVLNNNFADATNMKEALIYDMYQYIGADASLYNYAKISVNGEYWGVYLALEAVEDSFMLRNYGTGDGELYKPDSMDMGMNMEMPEGMGMKRPEGMEMEKPEGMDMKKPEGMEMERPEGMEMEKPGASIADFGNFNGPGSEGSGANLNYIDDEIDSYSVIWDSEVTKTSKSDHRRVVTALKNISEGQNLEDSMDVDNLLKYAAVHVFSVNEDSLSGRMAHNYYLYEADGKLNLIPWDYNLALGGMGDMGNRGGAENTCDEASAVVNDAIDNAFSGTTFFESLLEDSEYHEQYYEYMQQVDEYLLGDGFQTFYNRTRSLIDELVETDPNANYTYEEYEAALDTLCEVVELRGLSIKGQLEGSIPSTESEQAGSEALIDASGLDLSVMGKFMNN